MLLEPRGARTTPGVWNLDARVQKTVYRFGPRQTLGLAFDVFNVTNQGVPLLMFPEAGPSFGMALTRSDPRLLRVVARLTF